VHSDPTFERLTGVLRRVFQDPDLEVSRGTRFQDIRGWDSFTYLTLIAAVEQEFSVTFSAWDLAAFTSAGEVVDLLADMRSADGRRP
jgi:acyl carrier protein